MTSPAETPVRILIINPNTSHHMTEALKPVVESLGYSNVQYTFFTSPNHTLVPSITGIPSINSPGDATQSASVCLPSLIPLLSEHDAFLVACYSSHPLVPQLKRECALLAHEATKGSGGRGARKYVTGIFEASVLASLALVGSGDVDSEQENGNGNRSGNQGFGIVSTGKVWEDALRTGVHDFVSSTQTDWFVGCQTTGLNASELHELPAEEVRRKMKNATKKLLRDGEETGVRVGAVCLGCAGMVGLEEAVREACVEEWGENGSRVAIVDGVKAGVGMLVMLARGGF